MNMQNAMTAKIMGEILASGMSLSDVNLAKTVNSVAVRELEEIRAVLWSDEKTDREKLGRIKDIINSGGIY